MLGKQRIPTIAMPGTSVAAETARIEPITHPGPHDGPKITWLSPEGRGKGVEAVRVRRIAVIAEQAPANICPGVTRYVCVSGLVRRVG